MDISRMLRDKDYAETITEEELFRSSGIARYLQAVAEGIAERWERPPRVVLKERAAFVAKTDNDSIYINTGNRLVGNVSGTINKLKALLGILYHELSHILYSDFEFEKKMRETMLAGNFPGEEPTGVSKEALEKMKTLLKDPKWRQVFCHTYHDLENFVADRCDENSLIAAYTPRGKGRKSLVEECILMVRKRLRLGTPPLEDMLERTGGAITVQIMLDLIFQYIRFGNVIVRDKATMDSEAAKMLEEYKEDADSAVATHDMTQRYLAYSRIVLRLLPLMEDHADISPDDGSQGDGAEQQGGGEDGQGSDSSGSEQGSPDASASQDETQPQSGSGASQPTQQQGEERSDTAGDSSSGLDDLLESIKNASKDAGGTESANRRKNSRAINSAQAAENPEDGEQDITTTPSSVKREAEDPTSDEQDSQLEAILQSIVNTLAKEKAEMEADQMAFSQLEGEIRAINACGPHKDTKIVFVHRKDNSPTAVNTYNELYQGIKHSVARSKELLRRELNNLTQGEELRHLPFGRRLDVRDTYRPDQKCWINRKAPVEAPKIAVSVLMDGSGSMSEGDRIPAARKAAIIVEDLCRDLGFPVMVTLHWADGYVNDCHLEIACQFDQVRKCNRYSVAALNHGPLERACARDGCAIEIAAGLLAKRPEPIKLLFVLSDGKPNHPVHRDARYAYGGAAAEKDIASIIKRYKRMGVETIAAAIGDDREAIERIYGTGFLDVSDLNALPKMLTNIIKKRIAPYL